MNNVNKEIIEWINAQPYWVQLAATKVYAKEEIKDDMLNELLALLKTKEGQSKDTKIDLTTIFNGSSAATNDIRILSIGEIEGIDKLAPRSPLPFSPNLSVVYGHNGSGKSGYARILKKLCGKHNATELLPNVFKNIPEKRQCTIVADMAGTKKTFVWKANDKPIDELIPVDIFDSQTGFFYIDKEQEVSYVPNEVALFEQLAIVFQMLQQKLKAEQAAIYSKLPARPTEFGSSKYIAAMFDRLKYNSDVDTVEGFFKFSEDDVKELARLEERLSASPFELASKKQKRITQMELLIEQLIVAAGLVSSASVNALEQLENDALQKRKIAKQAADALMSEASFDGFGNELWKAMWQAARQYSEKNAYPETAYPVVEQGAKCVLCQQELGAPAKQRLMKFENYVVGEIESSATAAEIVFQGELNKLPIMPQKNELVTTLQAA